ncbi:MAG: YdcF family protein [Bdellovibrionales bacterium]|nr:YdcF family protein [Bdellovibrionales bacterium]
MKKRKLILSLFLGCGLLFSVFFAGLCFSSYKKVSSYPVTAWHIDHKADCGIVLTGGPGRIFDGFEMLYLNRVKKLIISGVNPKTELNDIFPQRAFYGELDPGDIILEKSSLTTYGNAQQTLPLIEALNCRDVVLITSKLHMHRAYKTFRATFPEEIPVYQRSTVGKGDSLHWTRVWSESIKAVFYDLWFY